MQSNGLIVFGRRDDSNLVIELSFHEKRLSFGERRQRGRKLFGIICQLDGNAESLYGASQTSHKASLVQVLFPFDSQNGHFPVYSHELIERRGDRRGKRQR